MNRLVAMIKTLFCAVLPKVMEFLTGIWKPAMLCAATIVLCMIAGVHAAAVIAVAVVVIMAISARGTLEAVQDYYREELKRQEQSRK